MYKKIISLALLLCPLALNTAWAQSEVGGATLNGTVNDASQAVVTGAAVKLSNSDTGFNREVVIHR